LEQALGGARKAPNLLPTVPLGVGPQQ